MGRGAHHVLERLAAETAQDDLGGGHGIIGGDFPFRAAQEIAGQQQAHHLRAPVLQRLRQRRHPGHDRTHEFHPLAFPDDRLAWFEGTIELHPFQQRKLVRFAMRADGAIADGTVAAAFTAVLTDGLLIDLGQGNLARFHLILTA